MKGQSNPFTQKPAKTGSDRRLAQLPWIFAVVATMTALLLLLIWYRNKSNHELDLADLRKQLFAAEDGLKQSMADNETNKELIATLKTRVADLEREKEMSGHMAKGLEDEMRADLESKDVAIANLQGKLTVTILDRVLFDSGEAILKPDGAAVMQKIATVLKTHSQLKIQVVGHTDNVPIRPTAQSRFASNWELSTARALAAVHYLTEKAGVDPRRVSAAGYGEFHPIADNSTPEGQAKNRRIAITILPEELAAADAAGASKPGLSPAPPVRP